MSEIEVEVTQVVKVKIDESKFTPEFMTEFRETMYHFRTIQEHAAHLAQLHCRGLADNNSFIEGYGDAKDMGIAFDIVNQEERVTP